MTRPYWPLLLALQILVQITWQSMCFGSRMSPFLLVIHLVSILTIFVLFGCLTRAVCVWLFGRLFVCAGGMLLFLVCALDPCFLALCARISLFGVSVCVLFGVDPWSLPGCSLVSDLFPVGGVVGRV